MSINTATATAPRFDSTFTSTAPATDSSLAAEVVAAARLWRREDKIKAAIDAATKQAAALAAGQLGLKGSVSGMEKRERDARNALGALLGGTAVLTVDGEQLAVEIGEKGGGNPDYAAAWEAVRAAMTPDWQKFMDDTLGGCVTKATPTVKITVVPTAEAPAPRPVAHTPAAIVALPAPSAPSAPALAAAKPSRSRKAPTLQ